MAIYNFYFKMSLFTNVFLNLEELILLDLRMIAALFPQVIFCLYERR